MPGFYWAHLLFFLFLPFVVAVKLNDRTFRIAIIKRSTAFHSPQDPIRDLLFRT